MFVTVTVTDSTLGVSSYANFGHERQHHTITGFCALLNSNLRYIYKEDNSGGIPHHLDNHATYQNINTVVSPCFSERAETTAGCRHQNVRMCILLNFSRPLSRSNFMAAAARIPAQSTPTQSMLFAKGIRASSSERASERRNTAGYRGATREAKATHSISASC